MPTAQKITPHLWFDKEAREAAEFYATTFPDSGIDNVTTIHDTPSGDCDVVSFRLAGCPFQAISAGPLFQFTPAISFFFNGRSAAEVDALYAKLSEGGTALMPLDRYPFSERYAWVQDRYGLTWQLFLPQSEVQERVVPSMLFVGAVCGKAEEAMSFYQSVFRDSAPGTLSRYGAGQAPDQEGTLQYADFLIEGQRFAVMDSALEHPFTFNEAISFMVECETQAEIDYYWEKLSYHPEAEQCGWLKDAYGVSWQVVPRELGGMMANGSPEQRERITQAFLQMKKFDLAQLRKAF